MSDPMSRKRRLTHQSVMSSDELITLIEENVQDYAIFVTDPERRIINWSKGAERIFGYSVDEVLGEDAMLIFTPRDRRHDVPTQEFQTALRTGQAVNERFHIKKDGTVFWGSGILTALRDEDGRVRGTVKILRDLTERRQFEEGLREEAATAQRERARAESSAHEVAQLNTLLRRAMAEAHHRIKNSFQILSALLEMHTAGAPDGMYLDFTKLSLHVQSLATIHDLLTDGIKRSTVFDHISATTLLGKLVLLTQQTLTERYIHADVQEVALPLKHATSLAPLFNEIITNAIKYGRGDIAVTFTMEQGVVHLEVCDNGPGFPADFDPETAAHTGMELMKTLTYHDLRGEIYFGNSAAGGAKVVVSFPISEALAENSHLDPVS